MSQRPFIPVPHCALVEIISTASSTIVENTYHVLAAQDFDATMCSDAALAFYAWYSAKYKQMVHANYQLAKISVKAIHQQNAPYAEYPGGVNDRGLEASTPMPPSASFCITMYTGLQGRSYRGRMYTIGVALAHMNGAFQVTAAYAQGWVSRLNDLKLTLAEVSMLPVVVSYRHNKAWREVGLPTEITDYGYGDLNLDCQRRRLAGRGM